MGHNAALLMGHNAARIMETTRPALWRRRVPRRHHQLLPHYMFNPCGSHYGDDASRVVIQR